VVGPRNRTADIRNVTRRAALVAAAFSLHSLAVRILEGPGPFSAAGTSVVRVVVSYWVAALSVGAIVGMGLPLGRTALGAGLLGGLGGAAVVAASAFAFVTPDQWASVVPTAVLAVGLIGGPLCGLVIWAAYLPERPRPTRRRVAQSRRAP